MKPMPCKGDAYRGEQTAEKRSCYSCEHAAPEVWLGAPPPAEAKGGKCAGFRGWELMVPAVLSTWPGWTEVTT